MFSRNIWMIWRIGATFQALINYQTDAINQQPIMTSFQYFALLKEWTGVIKNGKFQLLKINSSRYIIILL